MSPRSATLHLENTQATCALAQSIGARLGPGDTILLSGDVGAGKTYFARCLILSLLDTPEDVPSPTFTLVQTYPTPRAEIWHADLYRLTDASEIEELGLTDAFANAICLIEWPDRLGAETPGNALSLTLDAPQGDDKRDVTLNWSAGPWCQKLQGVTND